MIKFLFKLLFISIVAFPFLGRAQGIRFNSSDSLIINRTSYKVFAHNQPKFVGDINIDFNVSIIDSETFGYVFYIKDKNNPISYSLAYVGKDKKSGEIKLNLDGVKTLFTFPLKKASLGERNGLRFL